MPSRKPLSLAALVLALTASACDEAAVTPPTLNPDLPPELRDGKWTRANHRAPRLADDLTEEQQRAIEELQAIGYADGVRAAPQVVSVTLFDQERAEGGYNFYISGHATAAFLVDMNGELVHTWSHDYEGLWPELDVPEDAAGRGKWRRAFLLEDGGVLAIHEGIGMIRLDRESNLVWEYPGRTHHDAHVLADGTIWTLGRRAKLIPRIDEEVPSMDDFLVQLDADGNQLRRISVLECIENADAKELLRRIPSRMELFHTNSIEVLDGRLADRVPEFAEGNLLISMRHLDAIAVIDPEQEAVVWFMIGDFQAQHDPTILENGNLLLFDNRGRDHASTVYEFDVQSREPVWQYRGTADAPFYSHTCGSAYRLSGGNTLVVESDGGRAFEVTPDKEIVWEFFSPHRGGPDLEYIACLYDLVRVSPDEVNWLTE